MSDTTREIGPVEVFIGLVVLLLLLALASSMMNKGQWEPLTDEQKEKVDKIRDTYRATPTPDVCPYCGASYGALHSINCPNRFK